MSGSLGIFHQVYKNPDEEVCMFASPFNDLHAFVKKTLPSLFALQSRGVDVQFVYNCSYFVCSKTRGSFVIEHSDARYTSPTRFSDIIRAAVL